MLDHAVHDDSAGDSPLPYIDVAEPASQLADVLKVQCAFSVPAS